eukprot:633312-Amphidinium_carterae.1
MRGPISATTNPSTFFSRHWVSTTAFLIVSSFVYHLCVCACARLSRFGCPAVNIISVGQNMNDYLAAAELIDGKSSTDKPFPHDA